jgi:hypothetical protein
MARGFGPSESLNTLSTHEQTRSCVLSIPSAVRAARRREPAEVERAQLHMGDWNVERPQLSGQDLSKS